jgi:hypothetical protein
MTKQHLREFQWFAEGFYRAAHQIAGDRAEKSAFHSKKYHHARGARAAAIIVLGDVTRSRVTSHKSRVTKSKGEK